MHDRSDDRNIPISAGIPRVIYVSAVVGICLIFTMLTMVFVNSGANHAWPASSSLAVPLPK